MSHNEACLSEDKSTFKTNEKTLLSKVQPRKYTTIYFCKIYNCGKSCDESNRTGGNKPSTGRSVHESTAGLDRGCQQFWKTCRLRDTKSVSLHRNEPFPLRLYIQPADVLRVSWTARTEMLWEYLRTLFCV